MFYNGNNKLKTNITLNLILLSLLVYTACANVTNSDEPLEEGTKAPNFTLQSLGGGQVSLADHSGKVILLFFFGNG